MMGHPPQFMDRHVHFRAINHLGHRSVPECGERSFKSFNRISHFAPVASLECMVHIQANFVEPRRIIPEVADNQ